ncbi:hypothetical protein F4781DRAFT_388511 [Annulohypoxylon bovei var. microspora]|nr:hypothetical protein F4781DRAFT_388511 [Annulohypoxylon bovei var. microspora]
MATVPPSWLDEAFKSAKEDFKRSLKNPALYDFSKITSIDDVLDEAKKIERQQAQTRTLRGLKRVQPLINGLKEYSAIIEVFAQVKPDIMSLIWGPLKFILQASSSAISAFEKVVKVIADVGMTLPSFKAYTQLFQSSHEIRRALCLFFADILDFYAVLLNFLTNPRRNIILESLWPNIRSSITIIQENMDRHKAMMTMNVTLQDILQAHQARKRALEEYEKSQASRDSQTFSTLRNELTPHNHDTELDKIKERSSVASGEWLKDEPDFVRWLDPVDRTTRIMWLHGIPGSGKTFLVGNLIRNLQKSGQRIVFAFLSHSNQAAGNTIKVIHSFLFQLLESDPSLQPILHDTSQSDYRRLKNDTDFVVDLLCKILKGLGPTFVILDGLDELNEHSWGHLLATVLKVNEGCPETKLLISSREERGIILRLENRAIPLRVDHKNSEDINSYVQLKCESILLRMRSYGAGERTCLEVKQRLGTIVESAAGMFIYARLVVLMVEDQGSLHDIEAQIESLPDGLDEVYGRLLTRIKTKLTRPLRVTVRNIMQWVACAQRSLREEEMLQILAIEPGQQDFTKGRKQFQDICKACGPIIEIDDGKIQFVHFSAKEYLLHEQSDKFLDLSEAHTEAAITCTTYLSFSSLNLLFSSSSNEMADIQERIKDGDYVMFGYASTAFLEHVIASMDNRSHALDIDLLAALRRFQEIRTVDSLDSSRAPKHVTQMFKEFADEPNVQAFLSTIMYSQMKVQFGIPNQDEIMDSPMSDPLRIFSARRRVRQVLEDMICQESDHKLGCRCDDLKRLYGTNLYHCNQPFCYAYQHGFGLKRVRDKHFEIHQRPHKCSAANCLFADIGFRDTLELQRHVYAAHPPQSSREDISGHALLPVQSVNDKLNLFENALELDQIELAKKMLGQSMDDPSYYILIMELAASKASKDIFSYFIDWSHQRGCDFELHDMLAAALETENLPNIKILLSHGAKISARGGLRLPMYQSNIRKFSQAGYLRALSLWSPNLMTYLTDECGIDIPQEIENPGLFFGHAATWNVTLDEANERFKGIKRYITSHRAYDEGVLSSAQKGHIISLRICLENGGDPNVTSPMFHNRNNSTALNHAVRVENSTGAEMVKILLQYGADPEHPSFKVRKDSGMAKKIAGYFGCTWEEMVLRIKGGEDLPIITRRNKRDT